MKALRDFVTGQGDRILGKVRGRSPRTAVTFLPNGCFKVRWHRKVAEDFRRAV